MTHNVSPFDFLAWKEDDCSFVAKAPGNELGYMLLLQIDGISADDLRDYAVAQQGEKHWQRHLAQNFPTYMAALAQQQGKTCFVTTGNCLVEYADINTSEVLEATLPATEAAYTEAVRVEQARAQHKAAGQSSAAAKSHKSKTAHADAGEDDKEDDEDEDEYEDVSDDDAKHDEDDKDDEDAAVDAASMAKRHLMEMLTTQFEAAISLAHELGLASSDVHDAYAAVATQATVPCTAEACLLAAHGDVALTQYLHNLNKRDAGQCQQQ